MGKYGGNRPEAGGEGGKEKEEKAIGIPDSHRTTFGGSLLIPLDMSSGTQEVTKLRGEADCLSKTMFFPHGTLTN